MERIIHNPVQQDTVNFLLTHADTGGTRTQVQVELANGGGVGLHYHKTYSESFECLEGELELILGKKKVILKPRQTGTALPFQPHLFRNRSGKLCRFRVTIEPASRGFEQSLQIGYGLAADGLCKPNGLPKDGLALAWLFEISESNLPGWRSIFTFILRMQARKARRKGTDRALLERYVRF